MLSDAVGSHVLMLNKEKQVGIEVKSKNMQTAKCNCIALKAAVTYWRHQCQHFRLTEGGTFLFGFVSLSDFRGLCLFK